MPVAVIAQFLPVVTLDGIMMLELPKVWTNQEALAWAKEHWPGKVLILVADVDFPDQEKSSNGKA